MSQNKLTYQKEAWQNIWERQGFLTTLVNGGRYIYNWFFRRYLRKFISQETRLLEVGCGTASLTLSLSSEIKELLGVDIAESAIELSRKNAGAAHITNARFELGDCLDLSYKNEFDVVWSQGLMEHFDEPLLVAREHYQAAKPGGVALLSVPYRYSYHALWYLLTRPKLLRAFWPWTTQRFLNKKDLLKIGRAITPEAHVHFLQPFILGIAILELPKR